MSDSTFLIASGFSIFFFSFNDCALPSIKLALYSIYMLS